MLPTLAEALTPSPTPPPLNGVAPGRLLTLQQGLTIRREICHNSWILRFTGPEACSGGLIDDILDHIERQFQPKE